MKRLIPLILFSSLLIGCQPSQTIDAKAMNGVARPVLDRHDAYVNADTALLPVQKETYLRSSILVRDLLDESLTPTP